MSRVIRIPELIFQRLQQFATPLVDTPADVITRLLDFYEMNKNLSVPQVTRIKESHIMQEPSSTIPLNKLLYREPRQRGVVIKIDGHIFKAVSVSDLYGQVLKFLYENGYLEKIKKQLPLATSKNRYLISTRPVHPKGNVFWEPVEYKGHYMEAHKDYKNGINHLQKLIDLCDLSLTYIE